MHGAVVISATTRWLYCSLSGFRYLSLWQRSVRRWMRRFQTSAFRYLTQSGLGSVSFNGDVKGCLHYHFVGVGRSTIVGVQFEEDGPMVEEFM
jgi:hypothetical protein